MPKSFRIGFVLRSGLIACALLLTHAAFAGEPHGWQEAMARGPCPAGSTCQETCVFEGSSSHSGNVKVRTIFDRGSEQTAVRVQVDFTARYLFWKIRYLMDEINTLDTLSGRLQRVDLNVRYLVNGSIKRQMWDRFNAHWGDGATPRLIEAWRIQGKKKEDLIKEHPSFGRHWDPSQFGDDWSDDYESSTPHRRPDMDIPGFSDGLLSPLFLTFFGARFLDPSQVYNFDLILGTDKGDRTSPNRMSARSSARTATWKTLLVLGEMRSPKDKPTELRVDNGTRELKQIDLWLESSLGSAEASAKLRECKFE